MYPHVKALLVIVVLLFIAGVVYLLRNHVPDMSWGGDTPEVVEPDNGGGGDVPPVDGGEDPVAPAPPVSTDPAVRAKLQKVAEANRLLTDGDLIEARAMAEGIVADPELEPYGEVWRQAVDVISRVNTIYLTTDAPCPEKVSYTVASGDNLVNIARRLGVTVGSIKRSNGIPEEKDVIFPGQVLKIFKADWNLHADKDAYVLIVRNGKRIVKVYNVGIGKQDRTPVGVFMIENRIKEPAWTPPGRNVPFGHPDNVLGTRWMGLKPVEGTNPNLRGYGIHGTWEPESIGHAASNGCIRMRNPEVEELYDIVPEGIRVTIEE